MNKSKPIPGFTFYIVLLNSDENFAHMASLLDGPIPSNYILSTPRVNKVAP